MKTNPKKYLRRYTELPALIYMLRNQQITVLDPQTWDDKNDSYYLDQYKKKKNLKSVLALCFSMKPETYHHWRVFAPGSGGVCVLFDRSELTEVLEERSCIRFGEVEYLSINDMRNRRVTVDELPFIKRYPYGPEAEFRVVYESKKIKLKAAPIPISLSLIRRVTLSPWLNGALRDDVVDLIQSLPDCENLKVVRSTLINNEEWLSMGEMAE